MDHRAVTAMVAALAPVVHEHVTRGIAAATAPLLDRIAALEARAPVPGPAGKDGRGFTHAGTDGGGCLILTLSDGETINAGKVVAEDSVGRDEVRQMITANVEQAINERAQDEEEAAAAQVEAAAHIPIQDDRQGATSEEVRQIALEIVESRIADLPKPRDGVDGAPGRDGVDGKDGAPGRDGVDGKDGAPGADGKDGRDGLAGVPGAPGRDGVNGKDGAPGADGRDGLGPDDIEEELEDGGRVLVRRWKRGGEVVKEFRHVTAQPLERGTWREGHTYQRGDITTWGGSYWIALADTSTKPETSPDWRLSVKRGRDGKDGKNGRDGERGPPGKDGR